MQRSSWAARRVALGLLGLSSLMAASIGQAAPPVEKALPDSTVFFLKIDNAAKIREAVNATQLGRLIADPAMNPLKEDIQAKMGDAGKQLQAKLGLSLTEILTLPEGAVSLAVIPTSGGPQPVAVLVTADAGKNAEKMAELMAKVTKLAQEEGKAQVKTETFKGLSLTSIQSAKEGDKENPPLVWAQEGSNFLLATSAEALKDTVAHADGREDALASNKNFEAVRKKVGDEGQVLWFLSIEGLIKAVTKNLGEQGGNAQQIEAQLQLTGLNGLKALGGRVGFNMGEYDQLVKTYVYLPGEPSGLLKLFPMPAVDLAPQPWVPASVASYQSMSWDLDKTYTAISELADTLAPGMLANFEQNLAGPKGEGLSFQKDIFGPIGDRITVISDFKKPITEASQRMLVGVTLEDQKAFQGTLNKILALANASPKKREFQGVTVYDFDLPEMPTAPGGGQAFKGPLSLAIAKDHLLVATDTGLLEQIIRGGGPSLADNPAYQSTAKYLPAKASTLSFQRPEEAARAVYDMFKSGRLKEAIEQGARNAGNAGPPADLIDPKKIPDFSVFAKYLTQSGGFGQKDEDGMTFTQFSLKKATP